MRLVNVEECTVVVAILPWLLRWASMNCESRAQGRQVMVGLLLETDLVPDAEFLEREWNIAG